MGYLKDLKHILFTLFIAFFAATIANAQSLDVGDGLVLTHEQIDEIAKELPKLEEDKHFYHWAEDNRAWRWIKQGYVDHGEMDFLNTPSGKLQVYGPGLYLAESPTSSAAFGTTPVVFEMKKGTPIFDSDVVQKVIHQGLSVDQIAKLGTRINFVRRATGDWYTTNSARNTGRVSYGGRYDASEKTNKGIAHLYRTIGDLANEDGQHYGYLNSLAHLMNYQDGTTFVRSVHQKPHDPWSEFDPHNFEKFKNTSQQLFAEAAQGRNFGIAAEGRFGTGADAKEWAKKQVSLFEEMHNSILGRGRPDYRTQPVVGGGDQEGGHAIVSEAQYKQMLDNPYLYIEGSKKANGYYDVKIHYPTLENVDRFESVLSPEFFKTLKERGDLSKLSPADHGSLTQELLHDLLEQRFVKAFGQPFDDTLYRDMIAIHPFDDGNGRTIRLMQRIGAGDAGVKIPYFAISDLDIMTPSSLHTNMLVQSNKAYEKWLGDLLAEAQVAKSENRVPQLIQYDHAARVGESLKGIGVEAHWDHEALHNIGKREWAPLLDKWVFPGWQELQSSPLDDVLEHPSKYLNSNITMDFLKKFVHRKMTEDERQIDNAFSFLIQKADKAFDKTFVDIALAHPKLFDLYGRESLWKKLAQTGSFKDLSEAEKSELAARSLGNPIAREAMGEKEVVKVLNSFDPTKMKPIEFNQVMKIAEHKSITRETASPEMRAALNKILNVDIRTLPRREDADTIHQIFLDLEKKGMTDASGVNYIRRNFSELGSYNKADLFNRLNADKLVGKKSEAYKAVVSEGLKAFAKNPKTFSSNGGFFQLLDSHPLEKKDFIRLIQGFRAGTTLTNDAMKVIETAQFSPSEVDVLEKEFRRFAAARQKPSESIYALVSKLEREHPERGLAEVIAKAEVSMGRGAEFVERTGTWPHSINEDFKKTPHLYRGVSDELLNVLKTSAKPPSDIDEILTKFAKLGDGDTTEKLVNYARSLGPEMTQEFDKELIKNLPHNLEMRGFGPYGATRPLLVDEVLKNVEGIKGDRKVVNASIIAGNHPELFEAAKLAANQAMPDGYSYNADAAKQIYTDFALHHPDALSPERNAYLIGTYGSTADKIKFALKDRESAELIFKVIDAIERGTSYEANREAIRQLLSLSNPPSYLSNVLLKSFAESEATQKARFTRFTELPELKPWARKLLMNLVAGSTQPAQTYMAHILDRSMDEKMSKQVAEAYLHVKVASQNRERVEGRLKLQIKREKMGFPTVDSVLKDRAGFVQKIGQSILTERWSPKEIDLLVSEGIAPEEVVHSAVTLSKLNDAQKTKILNSNNMRTGAYDLLKTLSHRGGTLTDDQVTNWVNTSVCDKPRPKFITGALKAMGLN